MAPNKDNKNDESILSNIDRLVKEEEQLYAKTEISTEDQARLADLKVHLDLRTRPSSRTRTISNFAPPRQVIARNASRTRGSRPEARMLSNRRISRSRSAD